MRVLALVVLGMVFTPVASGGVPSPCALLTNAEATRVIGSKIETRTPGGDGRFRLCTWAGPALGTFTSVHAQLLVQATRETKAQFEKDANAMQGIVRVQGVGDAAYASTSAAKYLEAWQKGYAVMIMASRTANDMQAEKAAAKAAFAHL